MNMLNELYKSCLDNDFDDMQCCGATLSCNIRSFDNHYHLQAVQKDDILEDATRVARLAAQLPDVSVDERTKEFYISGLELVGGRSCVIVVDSGGNVVAAPENVSGIDLSIIDADFIDEARSGKYSLRMFEGGKLFEQQSIVAMVPIMRATPDGKGNFMGAAVAFRPIPQVREIQYKIIKIIPLTKFNRVRNI